MKARLLSLGDHLLPMLITALIAAGFTFAQTLVSQSGLCSNGAEKILEASSVGAALKGVHSISLFFKK